MNEDTPKPKIVILGGGLGSLVTALELTRDPATRHQHHIMVYHNGWRLGGKGASGRNADVHDRIEEHGLHLWLGFYQNAFQVIREVMTEWQIPANHPWAASKPEDRWTNAFKAQSFAPLTEKRGDAWQVWPVQVPTTDQTPGDEHRIPFSDFWELIEQFIGALENLGAKDHASFGGTDIPMNQRHTRHAHRVCFHWPKIHAHLKNWADGPAKRPTLWQMLLSPLRLFSLVRLLRLAEVMRSIVSEDLLTSPHESLRRIGLLLQLGWALTRGLLWNWRSIANRTLDALDGQDLRDFLRHYGASEEAVQCPIIGALYAAIFAYENGDTTKPKLAAGAGIRCLMRIFLSYKGALSWKMQAGMGDTIFTPIHDVLRARGVEIHFFHRVKNLELSADGKNIARVHLGRQVTLANGATEYHPFSEVNGLHCWPNEPLWDQLQPEEAAAVKQSGVNLEHFYQDTQWQDRETFAVDLGPNDRVVLGISIAALPTVAPELIQASPRFKAMVENVKTTRTQSYQAWLNRDLAALGWEHEAPVLSCFLDPLNTWAEMSHLLIREKLSGLPIQDLAYFCGVMAEDVPEDQANDEIRRQATAVVEQLAQSLWPKTLLNGQFDQSLLVMEYLRTNTNASDRYVLSLPGTTEARLRPHESGFANLVLAGDWTRNGINVGCVEATVMSGRLACRALTGRPTLEEIPGAQGP